MPAAHQESENPGLDAMALAGYALMCLGGWALDGLLSLASNRLGAYLLRRQIEGEFLASRPYII